MIQEQIRQFREAQQHAAEFEDDEPTEAEAQRAPPRYHDEQQSTHLVDEELWGTLWSPAWTTLANYLTYRVQRGIFCSSHEIDAIFSCLQALDLRLPLCPPSRDDSTVCVVQQAIETLRSALLLTNAAVDVGSPRQTLQLAQGLQDGIIRLARAPEGSRLAVHALSHLCGPLVAILVGIAHSHTAAFNRTELQISSHALNVLLATFSLIDTAQRTTFLQVLLPVLLSLMRFAERSNTSTLSNLCVQCLQRVATSASMEFQQSTKDLPHATLEELQHAMARSASAREDQMPSGIAPRRVSSSSSTRPPARHKLSINFGAYTSTIASK